MKHVTDRLTVWVGGELPAAEAAALERHLDACATCREEAGRLRRDWDTLGQAVLEAGMVRADLWPAVRNRTLGRPASGWFFGRSPAVRLSLAVATLALGVVCGRLTGGFGGHGSALADEDSGLAAVWLEESTWHSGAGGGLADSWLALADDGEREAAAIGRGGTK